MAHSQEHEATIRNPVLPGFHPDPCILRVEDDYYIAVSTFQWWPGVRIYHSRDLARWRLAAKPLRWMSQLDLTGVPDSGGVWAPDLSWKNGVFYLVYTNVSRWSTKGGAFDTPNFVVTCDRIDGEWSEPVFLNASGFDPSLFHDDDPSSSGIHQSHASGRSWLLNMIWDGRPGRKTFGGIVIHEYDTDAHALTGASRMIFEGTALGSTEGPHIYKRGGWYYLVTAEGGTSYAHAVTVARSREILGPYETHPRNPILTSSDDPGLELQKAGHGSFVMTRNGEWYMAHLAARPLTPRGRCTLGRETCLQKLEWSSDEWPELAGGGRHPATEISAPALSHFEIPEIASRDDFDSPELSSIYDSLRIPFKPGQCSLTDRPGWLRLRGAASLRSRQNVSLVARRLQAFSARITTRMDFHPGSVHEQAGLTMYYDTNNFFTVSVSQPNDCSAGGNVAGGAVVVTASCMGGVDAIVGEEAPLTREENECYLRAEVDRSELHFSFSPDGMTWTRVGGTLDMSQLSDEGCEEGFTGAFFGLFCVDQGGYSSSADFDFLEYEETS